MRRMRLPPNPNTKYGRKRMRDEAAWNYQNGTQEYRNEVDNIGCWIKAILFIVVLLFGMLILFTKGEKEFFKWLK